MPKTVTKELTDVQKQKRLECRCDKIRDLLKRWHEAGVDVAIELKEVEREGDWKINHTTFDEFLEGAFPNSGMGFKKYSHIMTAIEEYGAELVRQVGAESAYAMTHARIVSDPARKKEMLVSVTDYIKANDGLAPNPDFVRKERKRIAPETNHKPHTTQVFSDLEAARSERDSWKRRYDELFTKYEAVCKERDRLLAKIKGKASKSSRAGARAN